jgi:hypothetical protein
MCRRQVAFCELVRRNRQALSLAAAVFGCLLLRAPALSLPLDRDEGAYASVAAHLSSGLVPYRDVFDHKPPGVYVVYAVAPWLGGWPVGLRLLSDLVCLASIGLLWVTARVSFGNRVAAISTIFYAILGSGTLLEALRANTEIFLVPFLLGAFLTEHSHPNVAGIPRRGLLVWCGRSGQARRHLACRSSVDWRIDDNDHTAH